MALSPEWKKLPRRKCDDCGKTYKPTRPRRVLNGQQELGFCTDNCRKSYHKHGGAYRKLKAEMQKMVKAEMRELEKRLRAIVREEFRNVALKFSDTAACSLVLSALDLSESTPAPRSSPSPR
jgi:hypothetical protein